MGGDARRAALVAAGGPVSSLQPPLVSIGIPTYNREHLIRRAIESALYQTYPNVEVVVSDNASSDRTFAICEQLAAGRPGMVCIRQPFNVGAAKNFGAVLERATGKFFMWLGDDDYLDRDYVTTTVAELLAHPDVELVSGTAHYYRDGKCVFVGRQFDVLNTHWWARMARYYWRVSDNGMFYGVVRRNTLQSLPILNVLGGDWLLIARLAAAGNIRMLPTTVVHRNLDGASKNSAHLARSLGIPRWHATFPHVLIGVNAARDILDPGFPTTASTSVRRLSATLMVAVLLVREATTSVMSLGAWAKRLARATRRP